ncbi:6-hydroxy-D-nicotine oxidase [Fusarium oxysporum]|nr:6-hydroxy-D-nicotine oxidase [Fusarium oxysporum]
MLPSQRLKKKPHQKSKNGCVNCKQRKVKVGLLVRSNIPILSIRHAVRFHLDCRYLDIGQKIATLLAEVDTEPTPVAPSRRKRGRPRKDWSQALAPNSEHALLPSDAELNMAQAELLHQFITCTGPDLGGSDDPNHPIVQFWARNATLLAISHPYLLRLCLCLAAHHLAFLTSETEPNKARYATLARHHFSVGLTEANEALSAINTSTCGSLYVATILVCFCSFAAGPSGPDDLFICSAGGTSSHKWLPLARGARLIRELYDESVLFSGLTAPLGSNSVPPSDPRPTCVCEGFIRVNWIDPVARVRDLVMSASTPRNDVYVRSLHTLANIYEATFGDEQGCVKTPLHNKVVLIWLYMMEDDFTAFLQEKDAVALLLLAYYAPLVKTMKRSWFLHGWAEHIIRVSNIYISDDYAHLLQWPAEAVRSI